MKHLHNEACFLVVLWHGVVALFLLLSSGCGNSRFLEFPTGDPPDISDCSEASRTFGSTMPWTPWPFPFDGKRTVPMSTWKPENWHMFDGQLYLKRASWDIEWVDELRMSLGNYPSVATWDGERWKVEGRIDIAPYVEEDGDRLRIKPFFYARGTKPAGEPRVDVNIVVAVCGTGHNYIR